MGKQRPTAVVAEPVATDALLLGDLDLPRECRTLAGQPKQRYRSRRRAVDAIRFSEGNLAGDHAYLCRACGWWHIGHPGGRMPQ